MTQNEEYLLGIDGGGTKTEFVLFAPSGRVLRRAVLGGTNPNSVGLPQTLETLCRGIADMQAHAPGLTLVHAGIAGCSNPAHQSAILSHVRCAMPDIALTVESDTLNLISSADSGEECIAAIIGTGSVVFAKTKQGLHRLGGWGYRFSGGGSGYDIGRDAVCAVLAQYEKTGPETVLAPLLEEQLGGNVWLNIDRLYSMPPEKIASFAPLVLRAWEAGDAAAARILQKNMKEMAALISTAAARYLCGNTLVLSGGLTAREDMLRAFLYPELPAGLRPVTARLPQIYGACALCAKRSGPLCEGFTELFETTYIRSREESEAC